MTGHKIRAVLLLGAVALGAWRASGAPALRALDGDDDGDDGAWRASGAPALRALDGDDGDDDDDDDDGKRPPVSAPTAPPKGGSEDGGGKGTAIGLAVGAAALLALGGYKYSRGDGAVHDTAPSLAKQGGLAVSVHAGPAAGAPYAQPMSAQSSSSQPRAASNTRGEASVAPRQLPQQSQHQSRDSANTWSKGAKGWGSVQQQQQRPEQLALSQPQSRDSLNTWNEGAIAEPRVQPAQTQRSPPFDSRAHDCDDLTLYGKPISI
jgi:hypothetical protein